MGDKNPHRFEATLVYPAHQLDPEDLLSFIESRPFRSEWRACGLKDDDLWILQAMIMTRPKSARVVPGTGGLRKLRFSPPGSGRGKSGSHRVCYVYYEEFGIVYLITVYPKSQKDTITPAERAAIQKMIEHQHRVLEKRGPIK
jgi:hypothetical protein